METRSCSTESTPIHVQVVIAYEVRICRPPRRTAWTLAALTELVRAAAFAACYL